MNDNETGLPQLLILTVILLGVILFNPDVKNLGNMNVKDFLSMMTKMPEKSQMEQEDYSLKGNIASMEKMDDNLFSYLKEKGFFQKAEFGKKMVIYRNVYDLDCPYQTKFLNTVDAYKKSPDWTKKYTFVEYKISKSESYSFDNPKDVEKLQEFNNKCSNFCIIDFEKGTVFRATKRTDTEYFYKSLAAFYL